VREIGALLKPFSIEAVSASALNLPEPEETGDTFHANAEIKARAAAAAAKLPALADDSGLCVEELDGAPGIHSARWTGASRNYQQAFERIERELDGKHPAAHFMCVLCLAMPEGALHFFEGKVRGRLVFPPRGSQGFGYDPIFIPAAHSATFGEMPPPQKDAISHRGRAFQQLIDFLRKQN
jgi:XTP/dITP diphosphohydrolase